MISRYEQKEILEIWSDHYKFAAFLKAELAIISAQEGSTIPAGTAKHIEEVARIRIDRIETIEKEVNHDIIAFCTSITEQLPVEIGKFFHFGVTSSDIIDTALSLQIKASSDLIVQALSEVLGTLHERASEMKDVISIGRSHGMYAEPMSFGQKLLGHYAEFYRRLNDLRDFISQELTVQFSGAVGNYTIITPEVEKKAAGILNLKVEPLSTQIIPRDRIAKLINIHALLASAVERISVEIRHLHRSDVSELHEGQSKGQKGSSTMPHKKNPIAAENLTGMARMLKSHAEIAQANIVLWHERDISHSSAERLYLPDNFGILLYSLRRLNKTLKNMVFHSDSITQKVKDNHTYLSSLYLHHLIQSTDMTREECYQIVQKAAYGTENGGSAKMFHQLILEELDAQTKIDLPIPSFDEISKIYLKHINSIFNRVVEEYPLNEL